MKNNQEITLTPKELIGQLQALVAEAEAMVAGSLSGHSAEAFSTLRARFGAAQEQFSDVCRQAKTNVVAGARYADATIRENPYRSLAIAAGACLLVGVLVGRGNR